jgi:hypothetical protein
MSLPGTTGAFQAASPPENSIPANKTLSRGILLPKAPVDKRTIIK